ncbi:hypothetical protein ASPTUDRAFT_48933, partial [Aspergillus tubingensis CBS 134.48]
MNERIRINREGGKSRQLLNLEPVVRVVYSGVETERAGEIERAIQQLIDRMGMDVEEKSGKCIILQLNLLS